MLPAVRLGVLVDLDAVQVGLALAKLDPAVGHRDLGITQALDLGADEHETRLHALVNVKVVRGLAVLRDDLQVVRGRLGLHRHGGVTTRRRLAVTTTARAAPEHRRAATARR